VITCAEGDGSMRRATSRIINGSGRPITLTRFESLISNPDYATGVCEPDADGASLVLEPDQSTTCASPWVIKRDEQLPSVTVFTLINGRDGDGQFFSKIANLVGSF
jgi:hypothetical protein